MAEERYFLSRSDLDVLRRMVAEYRSRSGNTRNRPPVGFDDQDQPAPECYIALTPSGGIPALAEGPDTGTAFGNDTTTGTADAYPYDLPGYAECELFQIINDTSTPILVKISVSGTYTINVYNLMGVAITGNRYIPIVRDKFGSWLATGLGLDFTECP